MRDIEPYAGGAAHRDYQRWVRLLGIVDACRRAGVLPISTDSLRVITYLSEVLSPVWNLEPLDKRVLKRSNIPFLSYLQQDVDRLIGKGLVKVMDVSIVQLGDTNVPMPIVSLNSELADPILHEWRTLPGEETRLRFYFELAQAYSRLADVQVAKSMVQDATYGDPYVDAGQVIDLGEWKDSKETATSHVVEKMRELSDGKIGPAQALDIYMQHLVNRVANA